MFSVLLQSLSSPSSEGQPMTSRIPVIVSVDGKTNNNVEEEDSGNDGDLRENGNEDDDEDDPNLDEIPTNLKRLKPGSVVPAKDQLNYLAKVLGLTVTYQDFPKKGNKAEFLSLVSIATDPPQVGVQLCNEL